MAAAHQIPFHSDAVQGAGLASFANEIGVSKPFVLIAAHALYGIIIGSLYSLH